MDTRSGALSDLDDETEALAARVITSIEAGDFDSLASCFAPDAVIWHNDDDLEVDFERVRRVLGWLHRHVDNLHYTRVRRRATSGGYVQQHVVEGDVKGGGVLYMPACLLAEVTGGCIVHLDEYLDSARAQVLH